MHEIDSVSCWPIDLLQMFSSQNIQQIQVFIKSQREVLYYFLINFLINCIIFSAIVDQWDNYAYKTSLVESKLNCMFSHRWILLFFHQSFRDKPFFWTRKATHAHFYFGKGPHCQPIFFWAWSWLLQPVSSWLRLLDMSAPVARTAARFSGRFLHSEAQTYTSAWLLCARRQARASRSSGSRIGPRMPWWAALAQLGLLWICGTNSRVSIFCKKTVGVGIYIVYV